MHKISTTLLTLIFATVGLTGAQLHAEDAQFTADQSFSKAIDSVCVPALKTLEEPTTDANLTPYDPFRDERLAPDPRLMPSIPEPTTMGVVTYLLRALAMDVGNRIFEKYFKKVKSGLVEADFERIAKIVKDALREDAKRKTESCLQAIQMAHRKISGPRFIRSRALKIDETTTAILAGIENFDHDFTRAALMGAGTAAAAMQLGLVQEMGKRMVEIDAEYFAMTKSDTVGFMKDYLKRMDKSYLDPTNPEVFRTSFKTRTSNSQDELRYEFRGYLWNQLDFFRSGWCEGDAAQEPMGDEPVGEVVEGKTYTCAHLKKSFERQTKNLFEPREQKLSEMINYDAASFSSSSSEDWNLSEAMEAIRAMPFTNED